MPQRESVKTLTDLCVQSIASNLDKLGSSGVGRGISLPSDKGIGDDELSCFEYLPSQLVVSIMDAALTNGCTALKDKDLLALLITSRLDTLDLTQRTTPTRGQWSTKLDDQTVLHLLRTAALRHSPLKTLAFNSLGFVGTVPCVVFKDLLPAFPNLKKLDVSYSSDETINDDFLALLATCCLNLEELRLIDCYGVTDVGIQQLYGNHQDGTNGGVDRGCKFLLRLNVDETRVTRHGARLALEHLLRLQHFDHPSTLQIAAQMHQTNGRLLNLKYLNATSVTWVSDPDFKVPYVRGTLMDALQLCPLVVHVTIRGIVNFLDSDLAALLNLKCLKKLTLKRCQDISFNGGLLPILVKFGPSSLERLTLIFVQEVNIGSIVEFCSNLRVIRLEYIEHYFPSRPGLRRTIPRHALPHLRHLSIRGLVRDLPEEQPSRSDLSLLLSSAPALERIELHRLRELTDGILEEAMALHGFTHLQEVTIEHCPGISKGVVNRLFGAGQQ